MKTKDKNLRTWFYIQKPSDYEVFCDKCQGSNCAWSEFKSKIWCYDCEIDTDGTPGIFGGPVPIALSHALGINFHIFHLRLNRILYHVVNKNGTYGYWSSPKGKIDQNVNLNSGNENG